MNRCSILAVVAALTGQALYGCKITIINDIQARIFAFDDGHNEGNVIEPGEEAFYGAMGRHPDVTLYIPVTPEDTSFKKAYKVTQIACAREEKDKIVPVSAIIADTLDKDLYTITNFATGMDTLTCCGHHGSPMTHEGSVDELSSEMHEE